MSIPMAADVVLSRVREIADRRSVECYLTGGFVRDSIVGRPTADVDLVVGCDAMGVAREAAAAIGGKYVSLDEPHQIARVIVPGEEHLHLDFATIRGGIENDLLLRDFTMNAVAVDLHRAHESGPALVDPTGGERDIRAGLVRAIAEPRLREDPARLVRAPRLAAELGFSIEPETRAMIQRNHQLIADVAAERVRDELCRLLAVPGAAGWLRVLDELGLLMVVLPELAATKGVEQPKEHVWDVFEHSIQTVAGVEFVLREDAAGLWGRDILNLVPWSDELETYFREEVSVGHTRGMLLKLTALLHDVAKPQTKFIDENGRMRFFGHGKEGAGIAYRAMRRLRFSARESSMVSTMVENHLRPAQMGGEMPSRRAIYRYFRDTGEVGVDTMFLSLADHLATRGFHLELEGWREHAQSMAYVLEQRTRDESVVRPPKLISGHDLIDTFDMEPGPRIGELLEAVGEAHAAGEVTTREDALAFVREWLGARS